MVATDPSTFARNSINIYTQKVQDTGGQKDRPTFDPDAFAKTIIKSSNLNMTSTPRKESTTTTTIGAPSGSASQPVPVEQPASIVDSGIDLGVTGEGEGEAKEKKKV
ncbi:uncharacterized protein LOC106011570 [Aplysia californica]|uniref:Uncharacterized protein LOC106011570 n=1 Tax=Aplysia californica TaxID=6500 RepID=A0ABM0ZYG7_APLCA|nr:uncharacterized protein LOC106011570 [Aplysia californica]